MRLVIAVSTRLFRTSDGAVWSSGPTRYSFWQRYLDVFDEVVIAARVKDVSQAPSDAQRVNGQAVSVYPLPYYVGPAQYLRMRFEVQRALLNLLVDQTESAFLFRGAGGMLQKKLVKSGVPYGAEIVGDPYDVFAPGAVKHPFRPFFRWNSVRNLKSMTRSACAVSYVTEGSLQIRYPAASDAYTTHYSSIDLSDEGFVSSPTSYTGPLIQPRLSFVGSLEQMYKGLDVLLEAMVELRRGGIEASLAVIGDGKHRQALEHQATMLGLESRVSFVGKVPSGEPVRNYLDQSDIFVMPSRTEGLPRAMIEAMARGMPCIGSRVGGIPELLHEDDLVPVNNALALADKIIEIVSDPQRMTKMSRRNLERSHDYGADVLRERRNRMYQHLRNEAEAWQRKRS